MNVILSSTVSLNWGFLKKSLVAIFDEKINFFVFGYGKFKLPLCPVTYLGGCSPRGKKEEPRDNLCPPVCKSLHPI